ncbi:MAG: hypothetical protein HY795_17400 [Desulfovibrio sp.]|nr:hypothetical protein [Desulfovibrio sp.]MBI4958814.1 hypothetical protein [Desulfovibrio sp.]
MLIDTTGLIALGVCEVQTKQCEAKKLSSITAVLGPGRQQINVCGACLEAKIRSGEWEVEGAATQKMRRRADIAILINKSIKAVFEVKAISSSKYGTNKLYAFLNDIKKKREVDYLVYIFIDKICFNKVSNKISISSTKLDHECNWIYTKDILDSYFKKLHINYRKDNKVEMHADLQNAFILWLNDIKDKRTTIPHDIVDDDFLNIVEKGEIVREALL